MQSSTLYRQCKLKRGNIEYITFLPSLVAKVGSSVIIKTDNSHWIIEEVYRDLFTQEEVNGIHKAQVDRQKTLK